MSTPARFTLMLGDLIDSMGGRGVFKSELMSDYPLYTERTLPDGTTQVVDRDKLNDKIIDHYLYREIGQETDVMFKHIFKRKLNEIMPFYNDLFKTEYLKLRYNPLWTLDYFRDGTSVQDGTHNTDNVHNVKNQATIHATENVKANSHTDSSADSNGWNKQINKEFPQFQLSEGKDYATNGAEGWSTSHSTSQSDTRSNTDTVSDTSKRANEDFTGNENGQTHDDGVTWEHTYGRGIDGSALIAAYRQTVINIEQMIVDEMCDCFMLISSNGDNYQGGSTYGYGYGPWWGYWPGSSVGIMR